MVRTGRNLRSPQATGYIHAIASLAVPPTSLVDPEDEDDDAALLAASDQNDADLADPAPTPNGRLRHLPEDVEWPAESWAERELRRRRLAECDQLLGAIEEHNARRGSQEPVPAHLIAWYRALGGARRAVRRGEALIEAVFELQRPCVRRPILPDEPPFPRIRRRNRVR